MSSPINVTCGVPQGSVLGHILFLIYINELPDYIQNNLPVKLFADDIIIYHSITNQQDSNALPRGSVCPTTVGGRLSHALPPTKMPNHAHHQQTQHHPIHLHHTQSQPPNNQHSQIPRYPYPQDPKLEHSHQQDCTESNTTSAFLHINIRTWPRKIKHIAYTTLVRPILEYASIIWDPHTDSNIHKLETVKRRSAKRIMHNYNRHASVTTMLQHLDLPTLQQRGQHSKIITLYRIRRQLANIPTTTYITPATRNTQHYILPYVRTHVFKIIFLPKLWNNLQPAIINSTTIPQLRQALQSTPTSGRRGATLSA